MKMSNEIHGVHYDDPSTTQPQLYKVDFCVSVDNDVPENRYAVSNKIIPSGRCAVANAE